MTLNFLEGLNPVFAAMVGGGFAWFMTACGAAVVLFFRQISKRVLDTMLGFAGGIMFAAAFWSLLAPAIEMSEGKSTPAWVPALVGFLLGGAFLRVVDMVLPHLHLGFEDEATEGPHTSWRRTTLFILAIVLHNIPEGLAIGVAFGAAPATGDVTFAAAVALALGIAIQDFPEGLAVAVPLRREGLSRFKSFFWGQSSGFVEIIAAIIGALLVMSMTTVLPYALAFAAGAMIYVIVEEVIPESQHSGNSDLATLGFMAGFALMMVLDVGLG